MIHRKNLQKAICLSFISMLVLLTVGPYSIAAQQPTVLDIIQVKGGFGKVSITVKNIGNTTAENVSMTISVQGGILGKINVTKVCTGCGNCSNLIEPDATKTESTLEAGVIIGFGPITISTSAEASNAEIVNKNYNGFVIGFLVIITK